MKGAKFQTVMKHVIKNWFQMCVPFNLCLSTCAFQLVPFNSLTCAFQLVAAGRYTLGDVGKAMATARAVDPEWSMLRASIGFIGGGGCTTLSSLFF